MKKVRQDEGDVQSLEEIDNMKNDVLLHVNRTKSKDD